MEPEGWTFHEKEIPSRIVIRFEKANYFERCTPQNAEDSGYILTSVFRVPSLWGSLTTSPHLQRKDKAYKERLGRF